MNEMMRRVGQVIVSYSACSGVVQLPCSEGCECWQTARSVIAAMREPTKAMLQAGIATSGSCFTCNRDWVAPPSVVFRAMIDEALKD